MAGFTSGGFVAGSTPYQLRYVTQRKGHLILIWGKCHQEMDQSHQRIGRIIDYFLHLISSPFSQRKEKKKNGQT